MDKKRTAQENQEQYVKRIKGFNKFLIVILIIQLATSIVNNSYSIRANKEKLYFFEIQLKFLETQEEFLKSLEN